jgi:cytochrome b involved in lipid metabolism
VILEVAEKDATEAFDQVGHSKEADAQLSELQIGVLDSAVCANSIPSL